MSTTPTKTRSKVMTIVLLVIAAVGFIVGVALNYAPEPVTSQYCENVRAGLWPDYNNSFKEECNDAR